MFLGFLEALRAARLPVSMKEHLLLLEALRAGVIDFDLDHFYHLARAIYVKDEAMVDRFDRVFAETFRGLADAGGPSPVALPEEWLRKLAELNLTPEEMAAIGSAGSWEEIMAKLAERLAEQTERHEGGSKWIGTAGKSPFGAHGYNPEGVSIGQKEGRQGRALKVWEKREFRDLDSTVELGTRNMRLALRRLRRFAREGAADEFDLDATVDGTARAGYLDIHMRPERHNSVKLLLFFDVGGSMDPHVRRCEELFSAARAEFRHLEYHYFHNCPYEAMWKDNRRRWSERIATADLLHRFPADYRLVFVGDASMSPYEITQPGGSVEHYNSEPGAVWLQRMTGVWRSAVWLNPLPERHWDTSASVAMIRDLMGGRMYPLTVDGLDRAMQTLSHRG
jgi:uncharacterized protein with von Willebrand factor type A (vWA) domain